LKASNAIPAIGAPALRALAAAGIHYSDDLRDTDSDALAALHGVGTTAIRILKAEQQQH